MGTTLEELAEAEGFYYRNRNFMLKSGSNRIIQSPSTLALNLCGVGHVLNAAVDLDPNVVTNWDTTGYTSGAARAGLDVAIFAVRLARNFLKLLLSTDFSTPRGYTSDESKLLGGFHCSPVATAVAATHKYYNKAQGDIFQNSIWDQFDRPRCDPRGMVKASYTPWDGISALWGDIYPACGNNNNSLTSAYDAGIYIAKDWDWHVRRAFAAGKRLLTDQEFTQMAAGSPEGTNIVAGLDPVLTSIPLDTNGVTILSDIGMAMMTGCKNQWIDAQGSMQAAGTASASSPASATASGGAASASLADSDVYINVYAGTTGSGLRVYQDPVSGAFMFGASSGNGVDNPVCSDGSEIVIVDNSELTGLEAVVYFNENGTYPNKRFLQKEFAHDIYVPIVVGTTLKWMLIVYDAAADSKGVAVKYDGSGFKLYANHGGATAKQYLTDLDIASAGSITVNVTVTTTVTPAAPALTNADVDGHGKVYAQNDIKQVAGGAYDGAVNSGTASRSHANLRTVKLSSIAGRYCCEPAVIHTIA